MDYLPVLILTNEGLEVVNLLLYAFLMKVHLQMDLALGVCNRETQESLDFAEKLGGLGFKGMVARLDLALVQFVGG